MSSKNASKYTSRLLDKRVLIFGATSGIGRAVAEATLEHGADIIISGSNQERLSNTVAELQSLYPDYADNISTIKCDLLDTEHLEQNLEGVFEKATEGRKQPLHHVVFTAGDMPKTSLDTYSFENMFDAFRLRLPSAMYIGKHARKYMATAVASEASITITSGTIDVRPLSNVTIAAAATAALKGLTRGLARELAPEIRFCCVAPGLIDTPLLDKFDGEKKQSVINHVGGTSLLKRAGRPDEVAEAYLYLMKDRFNTGQVVFSDGGYTID